MCDHANHYNVRVLACSDSDCEVTSTTDDVFEYEFKHPSGVRAVQCARKPSAAAVTAATAVVAVVAGTVAASVGGSVASSVTGSGAAAGTGMIGCLAAVQFAAATSDMCGVQSQPVLLDILSVMQALNLFNLRFPMPDFSEMPDLSFLDKIPLKDAIALCGVTGDTSLEGQARSEVGDVFTANVLVSAISLVMVIALHFLMLVLVQTLAPISERARRWSSRVLDAFPFMQLELSLYLTANQGLIISATQLMGIAGDNGVCFFSGLAVLMVPTGFLLIVWFLLFRYVRPSSRAAKVRWNEMEGEWALKPVLAPILESDPDGESEDVEGPDKDVQQGPEDAQKQQSRGRKRPTRRPKGKGKGRIKVRVRSSGAREDEAADDAHDFDTNGVRRSLAARMLASMKWKVRQSTKTEFHVLVEPLLEGWHNKRLAWVGPALLLGIEYGIGLAMGFGALAGCESEQVVKP
jgi:hypothetical protein